MAGAVLVPLIFIRGTHLDGGALPYLLVVLATAALTFVLSSLLAHRLEETHVGEAVAARKPSRLETFLAQRIDAYAEIVRQRDARGDTWYFEALSKWDGDTAWAFLMGNTVRDPGLADSYTTDPRRSASRPRVADGVEPPHTTEIREAYFARRLAWLLDRQQRLRDPVSDGHRKEIQALAGAYAESVVLWRTACNKQDRRLQKSFWDHFPMTANLLEGWDATLASFEAVRETMWLWLRHEGGVALVAIELVLGRAIESGAPVLWTVNDDHLWLDGGFGIGPPLSEGVDIEALKQPYEELLARARETDEAAALRRVATSLHIAQYVVTDSLDEIRAKHVIRGECDLCR